MIKFKMQVFDSEKNTLIATITTSPSLLLETIQQLSELGIVKGYIVDDLNNDVEIKEFKNGL